MVDEKVIEKLTNLFCNKTYYISMGAGKLARNFNTSKDNIFLARQRAKDILSQSGENLLKKPLRFYEQNQNSNVIVKKRDNFELNDESNDRINFELKKNNCVKNPKNILIIGDTHIPYEKNGYLDFCIEQYDKWNCDTVIHIGDLIDSHATSRHPSLPDAYSPGDELQYTIRKLRSWYKAFPNMKVCIGNHDIRSYKIATEYGIASKWMKGFADVLEVPNWEFEESFEINGILYTHGTGTTGQNAAHMRALNLGQSVVIGHLHTESSVIYHQVADRTIFGMIVGCGVDEKSYGMNYAKNFPRKSILSCGVVLGDQPILCMMK